MTKQKLTRDEKRQAERAAAVAVRLQEWKASFLRRQARKVYTREAAFSDGADRCAQALYELLYRYEDGKNDLRKKVGYLQDELARAMQRLAANERAAEYSDGLIGRRGLDIDELAAKVTTAAEMIARVAWIGEWRVREIETEQERAKADRDATLRVVQESDGWRIKQGADYFRFGDETPAYATEELAWAAMHVVVEGRTID